MRYAIRVTDVEGNDMFLRHGAVIGEGAVVTFPTLAKAKSVVRNMENMGLDEGERIAVVIYGGPNQDTSLA